MKILYLEDKKDIEQFIFRSYDCSLDDSSTYSALNISSDFDHILVPLHEFHKLLDKSLKSIQDPFLTLGRYKIYKKQNIVEIENSIIELSKKEHEILYLLISNYPRLMTPDEICLKVWRQYSYYMTNTLEVHITRLRKKLGKSCILCIKRFGYKINLD